MKTVNTARILKVDFAAVTLAITSSPMASAVTVTYTTNAPTENVFDSKPKLEPVSTSMEWRWNATSQRDVGQQFTRDSDFYLSGITLYAVGASPTGVTRVENFTGGTIGGIREVVSTQAGFVPHLRVGQQYVNFTLEGTNV